MATLVLNIQPKVSGVVVITRRGAVVGTVPTALPPKVVTKIVDKIVEKNMEEHDGAEGASEECLQESEDPL